MRITLVSAVGGDAIDGIASTFMRINSTARKAAARAGASDEVGCGTPR